MRPRRVAVALAAGAAVAAFAALAAAAGGPPGDGAAAVRVAFFPNVGHAIPVVGTELGMFGEDVEARVFYSGPQAVESLFAGSIDMAYVGPGPAVSAYLRSESDRIVVLSGAASGGSSLVARPGSAPAAAAAAAGAAHGGGAGPDPAAAAAAAAAAARALDGLAVAAPQVANTQDVSLRTFVRQAGLETSERGGSVRVLNVANPEAYALFARGEIDAAWVPEPWATMLVAEQGGERLFREEALWPDGRFASVLLVARSGFAEANPGAVDDWLAAHGAAAAWIRDNPGEAREAFARFLDREVGASFPDAVMAEAFSNIEITADPVEGSVAEFASRSAELGYLGRDAAGRGGAELVGGMFHGPA